MMMEVVAALLWSGDRFLVCKRPPHKARGGLWEFVGGKIETDETGKEALARECREELDIEVDVGEVFAEVTHAYPDVTVHLTVYHATLRAGTPRLLEHSEIRWIKPADISALEFCPADVDILDAIMHTYAER